MTRMPEGDAIFRAARTLHAALAGHTVTGFQTVFPKLARIDDDHRLRGRAIERVEARGKHLLIWFGSDLVLRTHMRMNGSWHIYRPGERWQRPRRDMRIVIETAVMHAVAFNVPVAEFETAESLGVPPAGAPSDSSWGLPLHRSWGPPSDGPVAHLGPDPLSNAFDAAEAVRRISARHDMEIADALLDQTAIAGIGNIYKSELLFMTGVNPFTRVPDVAADDLARIVALAVRVMRANVAETAGAAIVTYRSLRSTTGRAERGGNHWVYGRSGKPCRRCGSTILRRKQGPHARATSWCDRCQARQPE